MPYPVRCALVIPKDAEAWAEDAAPLVENTIKAMRNWMEHETGYTFSYEYQVKRVTKTLAELQTNDAGNVTARDAFGEGIHEGRVYELFDTELGWPKTLDAGPYRTYRRWANVIGGGGWAGGRHGQSTIADGSPGEDYGECIYGDWDWRYFVTGTNSPGCAGGPYDDGRFPTLAAKELSGSSAHEATHMFGMDSHNPVIWLNNVENAMTAAHKQQFINNNRRFIEPKVWNFTLDDMAAAMTQQSLYKPEYDFTYEGRITSADLAKASAVGVKAKTTTPPVVVRSVKELVTEAAALLAEAKLRL